MTEFQKITNEIKQIQADLNHIGSYSTQELTQKEITQLDESFFIALEKHNKLIARLSNKPEYFYRSGGV